MGLTSPKLKEGAKSRVSGRTPVSGEHDGCHCDRDEEAVRRLELAIGRPWTLKDTNRVYNRMDKEVSKFLGPEEICFFFEMIGDPDLQHLWGRAISKEIDYLRAKGAKVDDPESMELDIWSEVEGYDIHHMLGCDSDTDTASDSDNSASEKSPREEAESSDRKRNRASEVGDEMCGVCFQALWNEPKAVSSLGCEHMYHVDCIKEKNACPLCKRTAV